MLFGRKRIERLEDRLNDKINSLAGHIDLDGVKSKEKTEEIKELKEQVEALTKRVEELEAPINKSKEEQEKKIEALNKLLGYNVDKAMQKESK